MEKMGGTSAGYYTYLSSSEVGGGFPCSILESQFFITTTPFLVMWQPAALTEELFSSSDDSWVLYLDTTNLLRCH